MKQSLRTQGLLEQLLLLVDRADSKAGSLSRGRAVQKPIYTHAWNLQIYLIANRLYVSPFFCIKLCLCFACFWYCFWQSFVRGLSFKQYRSQVPAKQDAKGYRWVPSIGNTFMLLQTQCRLFNLGFAILIDISGTVHFVLFAVCAETFYLCV